MDRNQMALKLTQFEQKLKQSKDYDSFVLHKVIRPALNRLDALDIKLQALLDLFKEKGIFTEEEFKNAVAKSNEEFRKKANERIKNTALNAEESSPSNDENKEVATEEVTTENT